MEEEEFEECFDKEFDSSTNMISKENLKAKKDKLDSLFWAGREASAFRFLLSTDFLLYLDKYGRDKIKKLYFDFLVSKK